MSDYGEQLKQIRTFPSLVRFLRDELDWPVATEDFEELTFDYEPEELGIDAGNAAKIDEIKRLRPLVANQPWGIFFVKFEPKQLPVVALRRILAGVVIKKRATASAAEQPKWAEDDLLFISNYGEGDARKISFAHFSKDPAKKNLPTLKVIVWDQLDTPLHLEHTASTLVQKLAWPSSEDEWDDETWRERWSSAFELRHREVITTSRALAERLAELARAIRDRIKTVLEIETDDGPVTHLMRVFHEALVRDLDADGFADMYAQTIAYGLLSARIADPEADSVGDVTLHMQTNPFLRELMETFLYVGARGGGVGGPGIDFDELGVGEVVALLDDANMAAVVRDFDDKNPFEDPVIHFYELFLQEYDPEEKVRRGVFYTPKPVVAYIVRSVDELLRTEFGLQDGLADTTTWGELVGRRHDLAVPDGVSRARPFVEILDPATGTGTFLVEAIDLIHNTLVRKWTEEGAEEHEIGELWNDYVPKYLLSRLHGYELLMAPYAIAHLKISLKLYETGYRFEHDERARIYMTNALERASDVDQQAITGMFPALAHESQAVNEIKRQARFTVVIGNPPYSGVSSNMTPWARSLIDRYKFVDGKPLNERKHWLQDDYVKFLRLAQISVEASGVGVLGFITNHAFIDNSTFRGMRQSLLDTFQSVFVLDLHGSAKKADLVASGISDQNVFDIQQGVAITVAVRGGTARPDVAHAELWGTRADKSALLATSSVNRTAWSVLKPETPYYFFVPKNLDLWREYQAFWAVTEVMAVHVSGITTARDGFAIDFEDGPLKRRVATFLDKDRSDSEVASELGLSENYAWRVHDARVALEASGDWRERLSDILYRPFDVRRIIYDPSVVWRTRSEVMQNMLAGENLGLCTNRQVNGEFRHVGVTRSIINDCTLSLATKERTYLFPLWLYQRDGATDAVDGDWPRPNLGREFTRALAKRLQVPRHGNDGLPVGVSAEAIFHYAYAILHSPTYRERYAELLKSDFPRLPLPAAPDVFEELAQLGSQLVGLHLLEANDVERPVVTYYGPADPAVSRVVWLNDTVWIDASATKKGVPSEPGTIGFRGVPEAVWKFQLGGFQVCHKWLKDRKGRTLSAGDIAHYRKIVIALSGTIRLMGEIDEVIEEHGGWPDAFASAPSEAGI